jgi:hypothetical protein
VDKTHVPFTTSNWNAPQTVTVTGIPDNFVDGEPGAILVPSGKAPSLMAISPRAACGRHS